MRNLRQLDQYRIVIPNHPHSVGPPDTSGTFLLAYNGELLRVIASIGMGWDHVSVSVEDRIPTWEEMDFVKRKFFREDEWAVQYHPAPSAHINCHPFCLHLWRPHKHTLPTPPVNLV